MLISLNILLNKSINWERNDNFKLKETKHNIN